jgi:hypothetical protein
VRSEAQAEVQKELVAVPQVELTDCFAADAKPEAGEQQTDYYDAKTRELILRA